jgi:hypothetical protein
VDRGTPECHLERLTALFVKLLPSSGHVWTVQKVALLILYSVDNPLPTCITALKTLHSVRDTYSVPGVHTPNERNKCLKRQHCVGSLLP